MQLVAVEAWVRRVLWQLDHHSTEMLYIVSELCRSFVFH